MEITLKVVEGPARGREFAFRDEKQVVIGRSFGAQANLPEDPEVSKAHCAIAFLANGCHIQDLDSRNGTFVNDRRVTHATLAHGDRIGVGNSLIEVAIDPAAAAPEGPPPGVCLACRRRMSARRVLEDTDGRTGRDYVCRECRGKLHPAPDQYSDYEVESTLAATNWSTVYRATDRRHPGRRVALKVLTVASDAPPAEMTRRLLRFNLEAQILRRLDHPGIVRLYAAGIDQGRLFMALEYLPGGDLLQYVGQLKGPMTVLDASRIAVQVLEALSYAHRQGIIHRDLKPQNILLADRTPELRVKLTDFGIAKYLEAAGAILLTQKGESAGTMEYISPDQLDAFSDASPAFDVFSAAATLQVLLTRRSIYKDFPTDDPPGMVQAIIAGERVSLWKERPDLPPEVADLLERALSRKPRERPTVGELLEPFRRIVQDPGGIQMATLDRRQSTRRRRR